MAFLGRSRKEDLRMLATELGLAPSDNLKIIELKDLITNSDRYDEEFVKDVLSVIVEERTATEKQKAAELEEKQKAVVVAQQREREFEDQKTPANIKEHFLDIWADLNDTFELAEKLNAYDNLRPGMKSNSNQTFKKKEEFRKPFPYIKEKSTCWRIP
ncbi:uncharacterized protein TNCV_192901 [Trichonephila clavipes]|nr:uncharacterized protein TNCV_192901 [Trichonephila clavipes]